MGSRQQYRRQIWVDGILYGSLKEAAGKVGVQSSALCQKLRHATGCEVKGMWVSDRPLRKAAAPVEKTTGALIRYPLGKRPLDMGLPGRWV